MQLVPENARPGRGGFPLRVEANRNQAIWFDIYVDRALAPGVYHGDAPGRRTSRGSRTMPIELDVVDVQLPDENTLAAMVYYQSDQPALYHGRNLDPAYHRFAKRHRVEFVHAYNPARARAAHRASDRARFHARSGLRGTRRRRSEPDRSAYVLRTGRGFRVPRRGVAIRGRVDGVSRAGAAAGAHVPVSAGRAASAAVSRDRRARRTIEEQPGEGPGACRRS